MNNKLLVIEGKLTNISKHLNCPKLEYHNQSKDEEIHNWLIGNKEAFDGVDIVIIPCRLGCDDALYMGLYVGLHIRLTKELGDIKFLPLIFVSEDTREGILSNQIKSNKLKSGLLLFTEGSKLMSSFELENLAKVKINPINENEFYDKIVANINIPAPENLGNHTVTNEWNIVRWFEMIESNESPEYAELANSISRSTIIQTLYFKHTEEISKSITHKKNRQKFKNKDKRRLSIPGIAEKKVLFIDDEGNKGWNDLLKYIFSNSDAQIDFFEDFEISDTRLTLLKKLTTKYIESAKITEYDVIIIDLRLCPDDFLIENLEELTSFLFIEQIKKSNDGLQIMFFTASNKTWNIKRAMELGATDYVVKESPLQLFDKHQSHLKFIEFSNGVKKCVEKSFLSNFRDEIIFLKKNNVIKHLKDPEQIEFHNLVFSDGGLLDQIFSMLEMDHKRLSNNALLICFSILENYGELYGIYDETWKVIDKTDKLILNYSPAAPVTPFELNIGHYPDIMNEVTNNTRTVVGLNFYSPPQQRSIDPGKNAKKASPILKIAMVLRYRNGISEDQINKLFKLRFIRNNAAAHSGNIKHGVKITPKDIEFILKDIFRPVLTS